MRARLTSGEIVELEQDCTCLLHTGPHWLAMDQFDRARALEVLCEVAEERKTGNAAWLALWGQSRACSARLAAKLRHMERLGIAELLGEES